METQTTAPQGTTGRADNMKQQTTQGASDVASTAQQEATQVAREAKDQVRELWGRTRSDLTDQAATFAADKVNAAAAPTGRNRPPAATR